MTLKRERVPGFEEGLDSQAIFAAPIRIRNGCHIAEVEIDPETGKVAVLKYGGVDDLGRIINPLMAEGQVHGGVAQGLGQALMENCVYDPDSGQLMTATFRTTPCRAPTTCRALSVAFNENRAVHHQRDGVKGAGEAGTIGAMPV